MPVVDWDSYIPPSSRTSADFAAMRSLGRTTVGKSFTMKFGAHEDIGHPARTVWQVITDDSDRPAGPLGEEDELVTLHKSPAGRVQVKARIVREQGRVVEVRFEKITGRADHDAAIEPLLNLDHESSQRLIDLCVALRGIDPSGSETLRIDEGLLTAVATNPQALAAIYSDDPERFKALIENDVSARDVVAIAARRDAIKHFELLLSDPEHFEAERHQGSREAVWQKFFEANPWILGVGLTGQLLTSWDAEKLERIVAGSSVADVGKRVDALLTTSGLLRSLVFAEIKLHDDALLESSEYRPGTWAPSRAVVGGVAQAGVTAARARDDLGTWLNEKDEDGFLTGEKIFAGAPRSFLIVGTLDSLQRSGRIHPGMVRSFELYRASTVYPEIVTYDELLARAKWSLDLIDG